MHQLVEKKNFDNPWSYSYMVKLPTFISCTTQCFLVALKRIKPCTFIFINVHCNFTWLHSCMSLWRTFMHIAISRINYRSCTHESYNLLLLHEEHYIIHALIHGLFHFFLTHDYLLPHLTKLFSSCCFLDISVHRLNHFQRTMYLT